VAPPAAVSTFVGRVAEVKATSRLIESHRLVTVVGPGGCGKTRLSLEVLGTSAFDLLGFAELSGMEPHALVGGVLDACGVWEEAGVTPQDRLHSWLQDKGGLLVLDNCEHLRDEVAHLILALLRQCPALHVLATSRVTLGVIGEAVLPLLGLEPVGDGAALFLERARRAQPALVDGERTRQSAAAICRLADGLPLAIELAAAHTRGLSLEEVRAGMADQLHFLGAGEVTAMPQHSSLEASIAWSVRLVDSEARRTLWALSVFDGRFTLAAAVAVAGAPHAATTLETLVDHSLVQFDVQDGRYVLLDTIRAYAGRELAAAAELDTVHDRLADWAAGLAGMAQAGLSRAEPAALQRVDRDDAGLRAALEQALRTGRRIDAAAEIVVGLAFAWSLRGRCAQGRVLAQRVQAAAGQASCRLTWATAFLTLYSGEVEEGVQLAMSAASQAQTTGERETEARALILIGLAQGLVDPAGAEPVLTRAAELAAAAADDWGQIEALQVLAYSHLYRSDHRSALLCADQALPALTRLGHGQLRAWDHAARADAAEQSGGFSDAEVAGRAGLSLALAIEEPVSAGGALLPLVRALVHVGRTADAAELIEDLRPFFSEHTGLGTSLLLDLAAAIVACWTDPMTALTVVMQAREAAAAGGVPLAAAEAGVLLTHAKVAVGDIDGARAAARAAATTATGMGNRELAAAAELAICLGDRTASGLPGRVHAALRDAAELGLRPVVADGLDAVAGLALDGGRPAVAARLHGASSRLRAKLGACLSPIARQVRRADERAVAALMSEEELAAVHVEGSRLDLAQAVAYASKSRGRRARPATGWDSLTPTESDVVALATRGLGNQAIADELLISPGTVRTHLRSVFSKLAVTSRSQLAATAARRGL